MKEYKVGEEFDIEGVEYVCVADKFSDQPCSICDLLNMAECVSSACADEDRHDGKGVHFEKVTP